MKDLMQAVLKGPYHAIPASYSDAVKLLVKLMLRVSQRAR